VMEHGGYFSMWYADCDGRTKRVKRLIARISDMSERAARRLHAIRMEQVNAARGSLAPIVKGQTFEDATIKWRAAIAPNLSPATVRPYESHLRTHILPRFGGTPLTEMGVHELQTFATDLRKVVARKTVIHVLTTLFAVRDYAARCGIPIAKVRYADLELGSRERTAVPFFTREQAMQIIESAKEPFKTIFALAWNTGLRAGEIMALTVGDLDFTHKTIRVDKSADDSTRIVRQPKTKSSEAALPMSTTLESVLRNYLTDHWKHNPGGILFPAKDGTRSRSRLNVVRVGLHPVLKKLGIPTHDAGLHAFRHGLATALVEASVPLSVLQKQMRHSDVATTLRIYTHAIPQSQRDAMQAMSTQAPISTQNSTQVVEK
jgi:integrase